jgi:hypothetical protein
MMRLHVSLRPTTLLTLAWLGVWCAAWAAGVRFMTYAHWQDIDPVLLEQAPWQSLFHLHAQPPLLNAVAALGLALFGSAASKAWYVLFALLALATVQLTFKLVEALTASRGVALVTALLLLVSPSFIAYSHLFLYMLPAALLATASAWVVRGAVEDGGWPRLALVAAVFGTAPLLWAAFHPVWLLLATPWVVWVSAARRRALLAMSVAIVVLAACILKNGLLFDSWQMSSWSGMNLARVTVQQLPQAQRKKLVASRLLSRISLIDPFADLGRYRAVPDPAPTGVPLLDMARKHGGERNLHHLKYVAVARRYGRDATRLLRARPRRYLRTVRDGFWQLYLHPASDHFETQPAIEQLGWYDRAYELVVYGRPLEHTFPDPKKPKPPWTTAIESGILLRLWFLAVLIGGPLWVVRLGRAGRLRSPDGATVASLVGVLWYVTLICNATEFGENQRFRFVVEPIAFVLAAAGLTAAWRRLGHIRGQKKGPD